MIIVLGDIHAKNKEPFLSSIHKMFDWIRKTFGTDLTLVQLGDLYDSGSPHNDIRFEIVEELLQFRQVIILQGNHDLSRLQGSALLPLIHHHNITIVEDATEMILEEKKFLLLPYKYGNMKELYEPLQGKYDYIITHVTPLECAFGDEGVDLKLQGTYVHGHTHISKFFEDKYGNPHTVLGVPLPTRHGEQDQDFSIMLIDEEGDKLVSVPQYFTYETVEYGQMPREKENILNVINAPSVQSVYEKYGQYCIREEGIELQSLEVEDKNKKEFEAGSLKDKFVKFAEDNNMDESLRNICLSYF